MSQLPHRLNPDTELKDNLSLINDNFDKAVQNTKDLGAKFSSVGTASVTLASGELHNLSVGVTDSRSQYQAGNLQIVPRFETYVDTDGDDDYLLGYGSALSAEQSNSMVSVWVARRPNTGYVAQFVVQIKNFGASSHTYYLSVDESYINSPATGYWR